MLCRGLSFLALMVLLNFLIFLEKLHPPCLYSPSQLLAGHLSAKAMQKIHPCSYAFLEPGTQHIFTGTK